MNFNYLCLKFFHTSFRLGTLKHFVKGCFFSLYRLSLIFTVQHNYSI